MVLLKLIQATFYVSRFLLHSAIATVILVSITAGCNWYKSQLIGKEINYTVEEWPKDDFIKSGEWQLVDGHILITDSSVLQSKFNIDYLSQKTAVTDRTNNWSTWGANYKYRYFKTDATDTIHYALGVISKGERKIVGMIEIPPSSGGIDSIWVPWMYLYLNKTRFSKPSWKSRSVGYHLFGFRGDSLIIVSTLEL